MHGVEQSRQACLHHHHFMSHVYSWGKEASQEVFVRIEHDETTDEKNNTVWLK